MNNDPQKLEDFFDAPLPEEFPGQVALVSPPATPEEPTEIVDDGPDRIIESTQIPELLGSEEQMDHLMTGIDKIDYLTGGFVFGDVIAISAATGQGKTEFCRTLTRRFAEQSIMCLWFSYEETLPQFIRRFPEIPLFYVPLTMKSGDLDWLENRIEVSIKKYNTKIVFIDHLHFLFDMAKYSGNISLEIGTIMRKLKEFALKHGVIIFIIAHLKKVSSKSEPSLQDMRDSSFVGQEADFVFILWRNRERAGRGELGDFTEITTTSLQKNRRNGTLGRFNMRLVDGVFHEVDGRQVEMAETIEVDPPDPSLTAEEAKVEAEQGALL